MYGADLLVTAISGSAAVLDVDRLRPGTTVIDDSFPHCFDTARALARMRERQDVLVLGGGLLHIGRTRREPAEGLPAAAAAGYLAQPWIKDTLAFLPYGVPAPSRVARTAAGARLGGPGDGSRLRTGGGPGRGDGGTAPPARARRRRRHGGSCAGQTLTGTGRRTPLRAGPRFPYGPVE